MHMQAASGAAGVQAVEAAVQRARRHAQAARGCHLRGDTAGLGAGLAHSACAACELCQCAGAMQADAGSQGACLTRCQICRGSVLPPGGLAVARTADVACPCYVKCATWHLVWNAVCQALVQQSVPAVRHAGGRCSPSGCPARAHLPAQQSSRCFGRVQINDAWPSHAHITGQASGTLAWVDQAVLPGAPRSASCIAIRWCSDERKRLLGRAWRWQWIVCCPGLASASPDGKARCIARHAAKAARLLFGLCRVGPETANTAGGSQCAQTSYMPVFCGALV